MGTRDWNDFNSLEDFRKWNEAQGGGRFSFRVGVFEKNRFFFDQLGQFFCEFIPEAPKKHEEPPVSVLGTHSYQSVLLDPKHLYQDADPDFVRQGDFFKHDTNIFPSIKVPPTHWIVLSQTCVVDHDMFVSIMPAYTGTIFHMKCLEPLGVKPPNPQDAIRANKKARLLFLPPTERDGFDDGIVVDLGQSYSILGGELKCHKPLVSLTFPGNAYFANRVAMYHFRDVTDWGDGRLVRSPDT